MKETAKAVGLPCNIIINEPTAAAMASHYLNSTKPKIGLVEAVFDLGGGTFDVTVLECRDNNQYQMLGHKGDNVLGGEDIDNKLASLVEEDIHN